MSHLQRTPLYPVYARYGAKTVDFAGWELPVQFGSITQEHEAVRTKAGLFDVSHMGEVEITGKDALAFLQRLTTNDVAKLVPGQAQYGVMCYPDGGTVDDLVIYMLADNHYWLVVNAANRDKDLKWLNEQRASTEEVQIADISPRIALLALQGPRAEAILQRLTDTDLSQIGFFHFQADVRLDGIRALVSRSGYTGEDGFELYVAPEQAVALWEMLLACGEADGLVPCGLGARDTLRFEAKLPLYGQELSETITPIEAGLGFAVKTDKAIPCIGYAVLKQQKEVGPPRKLVGIEMIERGIPRTGYPVYVGEERIGVVTTGTQSPTLKKSLGLALLDKDYTALDTVVEVEIRASRRKAKVVPTPFYKRNKT